MKHITSIQKRQLKHSKACNYIERDSKMQEDIPKMVLAYIKVKDIPYHSISKISNTQRSIISMEGMYSIIQPVTKHLHTTKLLVSVTEIGSTDVS